MPPVALVDGRVQPAQPAVVHIAIAYGYRSVVCSGTNVKARTWTTQTLAVTAELQISPAQDQAGCHFVSGSRLSGRCLLPGDEKKGE